MSRQSPPRRLQPYDYTLCLEGGGTHSRAALYQPASDQHLAYEQAGSCNPSTDFAAASSSARVLWEKITQAAGIDPSRIRIVLGCAGLVPDSVREKFVREFGMFAQAYALSDGYAALIGAGEGKPAAMVVAGTGCAAHRLRADGISLQRDGWGYIGGDRGSGFWIGLRAVRHALAVRDGLGPSSMLAEKVNGKLGKNATQASSTLASPQPHEIAAYARLVFACAEQGDEVAEDLLERAAGHLRSLFTLVGADADDPHYLAGSIAEALADRIAAKMSVEPQSPACQALEGCRLVSEGTAPLEWPED